jgi:chemotaxis signal transduction protein
VSAAPAGDAARQERLLSFEVGGASYALPIAGVLEVAEVGPLACVPTLHPGVAGVVNHHGDALPLVDRSVLLDLGPGALPAPQQVLVICARGDGPRLGLPVDRVCGLVDGCGADPAPELVAERRSLDGRVLNVLDPEQLVVRARQVIERAPGSGERENEGGVGHGSNPGRG